jgi:hypothetical protein
MSRPLTILSLTAALLLSFASSSVAQTGACSTSTAPSINPSGWVCITPTSQHGETTNAPPPGTGQVPTVVRYDLLLFNESVTNTATAPATQTVDIGKPTINAQGALWVQVPAVTQIPLNNTYKARVVTIGQPLTAGGAAQVSGRSPESNPFERVAPPTAPLAPSAVSVPAS